MTRENAFEKVFESLFFEKFGAKTASFVQKIASSVKTGLRL